MMRTIFLSCFVAVVAGCGLFGGEDESSESTTPEAVAPVAAPVAPAPVAPAPVAPAAPAAAAAPTPTAPVAAPAAAAPAAAAGDGAAICARAIRCCAAAFATPGLPPMYADRREQACAAVATSTDASLCTAAIGGWRAMVSGRPGATMPPDCAE